MNARVSRWSVAAALTLVAFAAPSALTARDAGADDPAPPIIDASLPTTTTGFASHIEVTGLHTRVPCENDSIRVVISGTLPNDCYSVRRVELVQRRCYPCAPWIRVLVDDGGCLGRPCTADPIAWKREIIYGRLPHGEYLQSVLVYTGSCLDTFPPEPAQQTLSQLFAVVSDSACGTPPHGCLLSDWRTRDAGGSCDVTLSPEGRGRVAMKLRSPVALKALQGRLRLSDGALQIATLTPIGPAAGMTLLWDPAPDGATFVMFSPTGTPIPATLDGAVPPEVLGVGVGVRTGHPAPAVARLVDEGLLGADAGGGAVPGCPILTLEIRGAVICGGSACDANHDGRTDVRDLVVMLNCLQSHCADSLNFDCTGDRRFSLDDVLCCARRMLRLPHEPGAPARPNPDTQLRLGEPEPTETGWRLAVTIEGIRELGAARLALRYPSDRFEVAAVAQLPGASNWLVLDERLAGEVALGLINLAGDPLDRVWPDRIEVALDLSLRAGQSPGGSIAITSGEFSARDGAAIEVALPARVELPSGVSLSAGRPNPFSSTAVLTVTLANAADVRVTVHDLSGRRVATLLDGRFAAGRRDALWGGRNDRGESLPDGIYFVRCHSGGQVVSRKVALLRGR